MREEILWDSEEGRLLARAKQGDLLAFESLVGMHQQRVFIHCYHLISNSAEAEDITSETFLRAYQHLPSLRAEPSIIHWLLRVANNLCISWLRKNGARPSIELDEAREIPSRTRGPEDALIQQDTEDVLRQCLRQLSPKEKTAVIMFYLEERPLEEIAKVLGCGMAGAKSRVHRARHRLRSLVDAAMGEQTPLPIGEEGRV